MKRSLGNVFVILLILVGLSFYACVPEAEEIAAEVGGAGEVTVIEETKPTEEVPEETTATKETSTEETPAQEPTQEQPAQEQPTQEETTEEQPAPAPQ